MAVSLPLPPPLAAHARLANVDGDMLVYLVDSPVCHARLRLASNELIDAARSLGLDVTRFVVRTTRQCPARKRSASRHPCPFRTPRAMQCAMPLPTFASPMTSLRRVIPRASGGGRRTPLGRGFGLTDGACYTAHGVRKLTDPFN